MREEYLIGLDIGGTKIEGCLLRWRSHPTSMAPQLLSFPPQEGERFAFEFHDKTHALHVLARERIPTEREKGYETLVFRISGLIKDLCQKHQVSLDQVAHIGLGLPGTVHPQTQRMINGNTSVLIQRPLKEDLLLKLGKEDLSVFVENDANCFTLAEVLCGAGPHFAQESQIPISKQIGIGIILGTGQGGGAMLEGKLYRGRHGGGIEVGHMTLIPGGKKCYCPRSGCSEGLLSGPGLEESFQRVAPGPLKAKEIFTLADQGDFLAQRIIQSYQQYLVQFLVNLNNIFDPDYFVFGGGLSKQPKIYEGLFEKVQKECFLLEYSPKIYKHHLGDSAGVIGAALLGVLELP